LPSATGKSGRPASGIVGRTLLLWASIQRRIVAAAVEREHALCRGIVHDGVGVLAAGLNRCDVLAKKALPQQE
jgi:hypothetical protein